jgi:hypothetical protein
LQYPTNGTTYFRLNDTFRHLVVAVVEAAVEVEVVVEAVAEAVAVEEEVAEAVVVEVVTLEAEAAAMEKEKMEAAEEAEAAGGPIEGTKKYRS